jgi:hypothetical protein
VCQSAVVAEVPWLQRLASVSARARTLANHLYDPSEVFLNIFIGEASALACSAGPAVTWAPGVVGYRVAEHGLRSLARLRLQATSLQVKAPVGYLLPYYTFWSTLWYVQLSYLSCVHAELTHRLHPCGESTDAKDGCVLPQTRVPAQITQESRSQFTLEFQAHAQCNKTSRLTYERLEQGSACTASDPYEGYFLGSFGVHGPELLHLQRGLWDGEEAVIAHKITGTCYYCLKILHTYFILSSVRSAPLHQPPGFAKFRQALCFCFEGMLARYSPFASGFELSVAHVWAVFRSSGFLLSCYPHGINY